MINLVLLFNTVKDTARVHVQDCPMVNTAKGSKRIVRLVTYDSVEDLQEDIVDLEERGFPVKFCKCTK